MRKTKKMADVKAGKMRKILVKELNDVLVCSLCNGYLIDATTLTECHHVFCRGCILRYFENCKTACPSCNFVYKKKNQVFFKADPQIQSIVYKVVPGLYSKEMQRREDFYRSTGVRASSSCSDDSVLERERDMINDEDSMASTYVGDKSQFFGPEDSISLSLEYYQIHLDKTPLDGVKSKSKQPVTSEPTDKSETSVGVLNNNNSETVGDKHKVNGSKGVTNNNNTNNNKENKENGEQKGCGDKRFLQCPAAVSMKHLQKFIRMKYALTQNHQVDIIYEGEILPCNFSLMDVAYTFKWKRVKPLRFFYRIFTPLKIQPIKIVNTTLSTGGKLLQIVTSSKSTDLPPPLPPPKPQPENKIEEKEKDSEEKERLLAHLQLQSKTKVQNHDVPDKATQPPPVQDCVFDYEEQDKEEIKRFAEIRDREWAMQKKLDESREREKDDDYHHFSKKRKKNKHSKNECSFKKRKLHAEITNKEEELKLKVKLTPHNGHKHKHHKSEMSNKEKLLQMRQVRHKHVSSEDKNIQTVPSGSVSKETSTETNEKEDKKLKELKLDFKDKSVESCEEAKPTNGVKDVIEEKKVTISDTSTKTLRSDFPAKTGLNKEWGNRVPTVQIERNEQTEQQAKKTFLKSYQAYAEKYQKSMEKKIDPSAKKPPPVVPLNRSSTLERKLANLQQRCTIETKNPPPKMENKDKKAVEKPKVVPPQYPSGFTVSKIESGAKRKNENDDTRQEKRPSLEITLINPPSEVKTPPPVKRPPPATIPLDRIKKSFNFKSGISIIPKVSEKCDNIGALDLSARPPTKEESIPTPSTSKPINGFASPPPKDGAKNVNMSNLQMLSKVATEHPSLNKTPKPRPQMPNLQTLKIPSPNQRIPPNLKLINKNQFRLMNPQIRNLRPNQNQSIRNIPNPSLLVRQQQNRLNSMNTVPPVTNNGEKEAKVAPSDVPKLPEAKAVEVQEVSV